MIPIVSLTNLISAIVSIVIGGNLLVAYRRNHNVAVFWFILFYLAFAVSWLIAAAPELVLKDPYAVMASSIVAFSFQYLAYFAVIQVPFIFLRKREWGAIASALIAMTGIIFVIGRLYNLQPHSREIISNVFGTYIFWRPVFHPWLRVMTGVVGGGVAVFCAIVFFYLGWQDRSNRLVFARSMYLGSGTTILFIGSIIVYFISTTGAFFALSIASIFVIVGLLVIFKGILHEDRANP